MSGICSALGQRIFISPFIMLVFILTCLVRRLCFLLSVLLMPTFLSDIFSLFVFFQLVTYAPFTLFPTPLPKAVFQQALAVQTHYNTLVDKISQDTEFLRDALAR